ncbi:MAG: hypothetical protein ACTSRP_13960 [Candidatus Helarchaeota archaeon]
MVEIVSGESLGVTVQLNPNEVEDNEILLSDHCLITPKSFRFRVLGNKTLNFKYRGRIWLLKGKILFKGYEITSFYLQPEISNSNRLKPICNLDFSNPIVIEIPIDDIDDVIVGHDDIFRKKYLIHPKLIITYDLNGRYETLYVFFTEDDLTINSDNLNKRLIKWRDELKKQIPPKLSEKPIEIMDESEVISEITDLLLEEDEDEIKELPAAPPAKIPEPTQTPIISETNEIKTPKTGTINPPSVNVEISKPIPIASPIEEKKREKPKIGKVTIEIEEEPTRPKPKQISPVLIPKKEVKKEPEDVNVLYEVLKPSESIDDTFTELIDVRPDSSINRCKKCGWIIRYDQLKCPRCGADTLY